MSAREITRVLKGTWHGAYGTARCPAHDDRSPSLSLRDGEDGRLLVHCFAGCSYEAVHEALRRLGLFEERHFLKDRTAVRVAGRVITIAPAGSAASAPDQVARTERALALWAQCRPARGTVVERYLASRGLLLPPGDALRFHPGLKHPSGETWPAMVALITQGHDGQPLGVHRTFLARDGSGKAPVSPDKMMLGPARRGVVRLAQAEERVLVGEGIETCLSVMQATGLPAWAALSTSGLTSLVLPATVREVTILADGDEAGERAARAAAERWAREGRRVRIARPPRGADFNDLLRGRARQLQEVRP